MLNTAAICSHEARWHSIEFNFLLTLQCLQWPMPAVWSVVAKFPKLIFFPVSTNANLQIAELLNAFLWSRQMPSQALHRRVLTKCAFLADSSLNNKAKPANFKKTNFQSFLPLYLRRMAELLTLSILFFFLCVFRNVSRKCGDCQSDV